MNIHNNCLHVITPTIATFIGQNESILLNQILYWISKCGRKIAGQEGKWIYNSLAKWHKQFSYWSMYKLRKTIKSLEDLSLIKSIKVNAKRWNHTKWYTINYSEYSKLLKNLKTENNNNRYSPLNKVSNISIIKTNITKQNSNAICRSKVKISTNRFVENRQIIVTKNNYTNSISSNIVESDYTNYKKEKIKPFYSLKKNKDQHTVLTADEKKVITQMIKSWNKSFEYSLSPIKGYSNNSNNKKLLELFQNYFSGNLEQWREYAKRVNSSQFLMGEKKSKKNFKAVFQWLIKEETVDNIMKGAYGVGDRELDMNRIDKNLEKQEKALVTAIKKKLIENIKSEVDEEKEKLEFTEYIRDKSTEKDKYGLKNTLKYCNIYNLLNLDSYSGTKQSLYESYLMKKHLGMTSLETKQLIEKKMKKIKTGLCNHQLFMKMKYEKKRIENVSIGQGQSVIELLQEEI